MLAYSIPVRYVYKWSWCSDPRGSQSAKAVALDSMLGKILESLVAECVEVEVKGKRRWVGTRRTGNLGEEPLEKVEETNLEDAAKNVVVDDDDKVGSEGCCTTKKSSCPSVFFPAFLQTAVIDKPVPALFENTGIGNPITAAQNRRFTKRCNKSPIAAFFKNAGIGSPKALG